jgi:hypothetical protein
MAILPCTPPPGDGPEFTDFRVDVKADAQARWERMHVRARAVLAEEKIR